MYKIAITGTKGKTTVTYLVSEVLRQLGTNVLRVDTTGHYVNGVQKSTLQDAKDTWGLVPTVCPGKYLYEFLQDQALKQGGVAVLEAALGSSRLPGTGYRVHDVGIFLNVFEDHLGSTSRLRTKSDIAIAKEFIFDRLARDGTGIFNADDPLVVRSLRKVPQGINTKLLPFGMSFQHFDVEKHLKSGGQAMTIQDKKIILLTATGITELLDAKKMPWTFDASFVPSMWNLMAASAALYTYYGKWSPALRKAFEAVRLDPYGGRLTVLKGKSGTTILADYAHEKVSLEEVAKLGRTLLKDQGKLIGVVRMAHDRTDKMIRETGQLIGEKFDECVIYEKIDGYWRKPKVVRSTKFPEIVGRTSKILTEGAKSKNTHVERILREDEALEYVAKIASPNDVVVCIVNDDIKRSIDFIKQAFKADFV